MNTLDGRRPELRQIQLCQLDILKAVKRICQKHGLVYYLSSGTLLGAVRHQGFIPWDDDVDIEMPYRDYVRFLLLAQEELGEAFFVQNSDTEPDFNRLYTKIRKNDTVMLLPDEVGLPGNHGVWIDIFPQIHVLGKADLKLKKLAASACNFLQMTDEVYALICRTAAGEKRSAAVRIRDLSRKLPVPLRKKLADLLKAFLFRFPRSGRTVGFVWGNISKLRPDSVYGSGTTLTFEGESFVVPADYDRYLRIGYGDYMQLPPEEERGGHWATEIKLDREYRDVPAE